MVWVFQPGIATSPGADEMQERACWGQRMTHRGQWDIEKEIFLLPPPFSPVLCPLEHTPVLYGVCGY